VTVLAGGWVLEELVVEAAAAVLVDFACAVVAFGGVDAADVWFAEG